MNATSGQSRWFHISLRTLLVVFTCFILAFAWFVHQARKRTAAFAAIRNAGGTLLMGNQEPGLLEKLFGSDLYGKVNKIDLRAGQADNDLLAHIAVLKELRRLDLSNADVDDAGLKLIAHLPLSELWLQETKITDSSAATLSGFKNMVTLRLNGSAVSDGLLEQMSPMAALQTLGLRGTEVTGSGMKFLSRHPKLRVLDVYDTSVDDSGVAELVSCLLLDDLGLSSTRVSDAVFEHLARMPNLKEADLNANRSVTTGAVRAFVAAHPKCVIEWHE